MKLVGPEGLGSNPCMLPTELTSHLDDLLPTWRRTYPEARLRAIGDACRGWLEAYMRRHFDEHRPVRLLVVAEAPPWKPTGQEVTYIYKPDDDRYDGNLLGQILKAVGDALGEEPPAFCKRNAEAKAAAMDYLGERGVLLVDPLPHSLAYSGKGVAHGGLRDKASYKALCALGWDALHETLARLTWHPQCTVAFSLPKSCRAVLAATGGVDELVLPGNRVVEASERAHCFANASGQPDRKMLFRILQRAGFSAAPPAEATRWTAPPIPAASRQHPVQQPPGTSAISSRTRRKRRAVDIDDAAEVSKSE